MTEWLVDERETVCPECGGGPYRRLAQHWAMSSECSPPVLSAQMREVVTGLSLAGASIYGGPGSTNPKFRAVTTVRKRALWWHEQLDWLSSGVREHRPERSASGRRQQGYQLTTLAHPALSRYSWTLGEGVPPLDVELSPLTVRAWLSHGAGLSFRPAARISFGSRASAARRERIAALLQSLPIGLEPETTDNVVYLSVSETERLQAYAAPPAPGSEYKWAADQIEYNRLRGALNDE